MHIAAFIVLALAFGISNMLLMHRCGELTPIRLSRGLLLTLAMAVVQAALFLLGVMLGGMLRFELPDDADAFSTANAMIFMGLDLFVVVRMLLPYLRREPRLPLFDLGDNGACAAMAFVSGINPMLVGLGAGFAASTAFARPVLCLTMALVMWIFAYWGLMLGRRKVAVRPRRWMVMAGVLLLAVGIAACVNAG